MAIEFGSEYRFAKCKSNTLIEFEIYNNFEIASQLAPILEMFFFLKNFFDKFV